MADPFLFPLNDAVKTAGSWNNECGLSNSTVENVITGFENREDYIQESYITYIITYINKMSVKAASYDKTNYKISWLKIDMHTFNITSFITSLTLSWIINYVSETQTTHIINCKTLHTLFMTRHTTTFTYLLVTALLLAQHRLFTIFTLCVLCTFTYEPHER